MVSQILSDSNRSLLSSFLPSSFLPSSFLPSSFFHQHPHLQSGYLRQSIIISLLLVLLGGCAMENNDALESFSEDERSIAELGAGETYTDYGQDHIIPAGSSSYDDYDVFAGVDNNEYAGEAAGDQLAAGAAGDATPDCSLLAVQQEQEESLETTTLCLDELINDQESSHPNTPPPLPESGETRAESWCGLEVKLSERLSIVSEMLVSCVDADQDCYYQCEGWQLPASLQDLDDRRAFINQDQDLSATMAESCRERTNNAQGAFCCEVDLGGLQIDTDQPPKLCRTPLPLVVGEELKLISSCQGGGLIWVSELTSEQFINFMSLNQVTSLEAQSDDVTLRVQRFPALSNHLPLSNITKIACRDEQVFSALLTNAEDELFSVGFNSVGELEITSLYNPPLPLNSAWRVSALSVNEQGLFRWELNEFTNESDPIERHYEDHAYGFLRPRSLNLLSNDVAQRTLSCHQCEAQSEVNELISATITLNGELIITSEFEVDLLTFEGASTRLMPPIGFFNRMVSTARVLGVSSIDEAGGNAEPRRISFSFWSDPELRGFLLHFEAQRWGFDRVNLISIVGTTALLQLSGVDNNPTSPQWGLYNISADRLQLINSDELLLGYFGADLTQVKSPILIDDQLLWVKASDSGDLAEVFTLQLTR